MSNLMQFIQVNQGTLNLATMAVPDIKDDECLINVHAIGVNRADLLQRQGKYPPPRGESEVLGLEVSGEIVRAGNNVRGWQLGQKVFGLVAGGGYAEYVCIKASHMIALPSTFAFEEGAATAEIFLTAFQSLFLLGGVKPKQKVLIHAGASGVGTAAIQLAKAIGCYVVTTVGSVTKSDACLSLGADKTILYRDEDFYSVLKDEGTRFNVIVDVVSGSYVNKNISLSALDGKIVVLSILGGRYAEQVDMAKMLLNRVHLIASTLRNQSNGYKSVLVEQFIEHFGEPLQTGAIKPVIDSVYSWQEAEIAHQQMLDNKNIGKIVLTIDT
jgi:putative PIG3 family NAD(P)H quinone oxidoreductase